MKHLLALALTLLFCLTACQKAPFITMTGPRSITFTDAGGTQTISFTCNRDWKVSASESWMRFYPSSGSASEGNISVIVTCDANSTYDPRSCTVTLTVEGLSESISVKQDSNLGLMASPTIFEVTNAEQTVSVTVQTNVQYSVSFSVDWIKPTGTKALISETLTFGISENKSYDAREGKIMIIPQGSSEQGEAVIVKQAGVPVPEGSVDLGIVMTCEDGSSYRLFWAECNLGASKPEEYGNYYAWGEIETKEDYTWVTYTFRSSGNSEDNVKFSKYNTKELFGEVDNKVLLDPEDDVAHILLGEKWRIPTRDEIIALRDQCLWTKTTMNGINGFEVKSKVNGNSIFLPAAGYRDGTQLIRSGERGVYWSSSLNSDSPVRASAFEFTRSLVFGSNYRYNGRSLRPVTE